MLYISPQSLLLVLTFSVLATSQGVPIGTRGGFGGGGSSSSSSSKSPDQQPQTYAASADGTVREEETATTTRTLHRNLVVEDYYLHDDNAAASSRLRKEIHVRAHNLTDFLVTTRRTLHARPELMYQENMTSQVVQQVLTDLGIAFTTGWARNTHVDVYPGPGGYGVVADLGTGRPPAVLLRADMDALPILERTQHIDDFRSRHDHKMHACGHDGHTTMLLGAAAILHDMDDSIPGTVRVMFQPAEEGGAGGKRMREEGVLSAEEIAPSHAFALHLWPTLPTGVVASRPGPMLAAAERFEILVAGVGGHAAMPHLVVDPIVAASAMVMNLQHLISRRLSPLEAGVCSVTAVQAGVDVYNVIPASATLRGTVRALTTDTLLQLRDQVHTVVQHTAATYGVNVTISYSPDYYPPTYNDPVLYESFSKHVGALVSHDGQIHEAEPTMGAEDFAFVAERIPSTFFLLGQGSGRDPPTNFGLHHPHFAIDETVLPRGVELHVNLALRALRKLAHGNRVVEAEQPAATA